MSVQYDNSNVKYNSNDSKFANLIACRMDIKTMILKICLDFDLLIECSKKPEVPGSL